MKRVAGALMALLGVAATALGLLFLLGAAGRISRYAFAGAAMAAGAVLTGFGLRVQRAARRRAPEYIRAEILALAKTHQGELSAGELAATLGERIDLAAPILDQLIDVGFCKRRDNGGATSYLFTELQPRLLVRRCEFCQAELPLNEPLSECPRCGGSVKTAVERRSAGDDAYTMDP